TLPMTRLERQSLRSSLAWGRVTNYPTDSSYEILEIERREHRGRPVLATVDDPNEPVVQLTEGSYALWSSGRLLVASEDGVQSYGKATARSPRRWVSETEVTARPLWLGPTGNGLIVTESSQALEVGRQGDSLVIHDGPIG